MASRAGVRAVDVEIVCSDVHEHRRRVESRVADIEGRSVPKWSEVVERDYRQWGDERLVVDTARLDPRESLRLILSAVGN